MPRCIHPTEVAQILYHPFQKDQQLLILLTSKKSLFTVRQKIHSNVTSLKQKAMHGPHTHLQLVFTPKLLVIYLQYCQ
jgi:hypothetical protein